MKHLKRFNEELNPYTYKRAAARLSQIGHSKRSSSLEDWANKRQVEEERKRLERNIDEWKKNCEVYAKYGKFKWTIGDPIITQVPYIPPPSKAVKSVQTTISRITGIGDSVTDDFYLKMSLDTDQFHESLSDIQWTIENKPDKKDANVYVNISVAIVPSSKETLDKMINDKRFKDSFWNGAIFVGWIFFKINVPLKSFQGEKLEVEKAEIMIDDGCDSYSTLCDRRSAGALKRLMIGIFNGSIEYPAIYTKNHTSLHEQIEAVVCNKSGLSSDYGLEMDHFVDAIKRINPNSLFKEY